MVPGDAVDPPDEIEKLRRLQWRKWRLGYRLGVGRRSSISCSKLPVSAAPPGRGGGVDLVDIAMTPLGPWLIVIELPGLYPDLEVWWREWSCGERDSIEFAEDPGKAAGTGFLP